MFSAFFPHAMYFCYELLVFQDIQSFFYHFSAWCENKICIFDYGSVLIVDQFCVCCNVLVARGIIVSLITGFFLSLILLLLNQRWSPPLRLQVSGRNAFVIMSHFPSIAVFLETVFNSLLVLFPDRFYSFSYKLHNPNNYHCDKTFHWISIFRFFVNLIYFYSPSVLKSYQVALLLLFMFPFIVLVFILISSVLSLFSSFFFFLLCMDMIFLCWL